MPLAAIGPVASFFALAMLPMGGTYRAPIGNVIGHAVVSYVLALVGVYVFALVIDALAPTFQGVKNNHQALKLAAYSSTPAWLCGIFNLIPTLAFLQIFSLYGLYLLYLGLPILMKAPEGKSLVYTVVAVIAGLAILAVIGMIASILVSYPMPAIPLRGP
jgi:hypothetical protein